MTIMFKIDLNDVEAIYSFVEEQIGCGNVDQDDFSIAHQTVINNIALDFAYANLSTEKEMEEFANIDIQEILNSNILLKFSIGTYILIPQFKNEFAGTKRQGGVK